MTKAIAPIGYQVGSVVGDVWPYSGSYDPFAGMQADDTGAGDTGGAGKTFLGAGSQGGGGYGSFNLGYPMQTFASPESVPVPGGADTTKKATDTLKAVSGAAALLPGIGSVIGGITGVGALIMNWWAANKQMKANKQAQAAAQAAYERQEAEGTRRWDITQQQQQQAQKFGQTMGLRQQAYTEKMGTAQLGMQKEVMKWDKMLQAMQMMMDHFSSPKVRSGLAQTYRR